jgi:hypothetical protein
MSNLSDPVKWKRWYPGGDSLEIRFAITDITDSTIISHKVGPFSRDMISGWNVYSTTRPNIYTVQWYMDFHLGWWPWDKFSGLLLEKRNGPAMEKGLDKLKKIMEQTDTTSIN